MQSENLSKAAILMVVLVATTLFSWELYIRSKSVPLSFNDDEAAWSHTRSKIYEPPSRSTVFIGSSRIKFDLDISTWEKIIGNDAIQLSIVGTSPRLLLQDLADDKNFKGKLIIDVTEGLFFNRNTNRTNKSAKERLEYYKKRTPAQKGSFYVNYILESGFVFLDKDNFSLNALLNRLSIPDRKGVFKFPLFPVGFGLTHFNRQSFMDDVFLNDTMQQKQQQKNWAKLGAIDKTPGIKGDSLETVFKEVKTAIDKIKARGGEVMFVRTPSSNAYFEAENAAYPRKQYWEGLLAYTHCTGIYFMDYPEIAHFTCPEWSHLTPSDAIVFTKSFINILEKEKGWKFPNKSNTL